jgi:hypothetical protein
MGTLAPFSAIRDFYFKDGLGAPPEVTHVHRASLVPDQRLFTLEHLRRIDNPLLDLNYLNLFQAGKPVDWARHALKTVQRRQIDRRSARAPAASWKGCRLRARRPRHPRARHHALAALLDRAHAATFSNATAFFSQRGTKAYRGHLDTDDVLVVHRAGRSAGASIGDRRRGASA